jgi:GTP 3',8-cyclase
VLDRFKRAINYLRISVTDRCNLRCVYCMPEEGIHLLHHNDILTYDEIAAFTKVAVRNGITKVKITGGEPLVRKGIVTLISMLAEIKGISDLSMTTNGILLNEFAMDLHEAGLQRVNISLDTVDAKKFSTITRGGCLNDVLKGIEAAKKAGLIPVKINCVIMEPGDETDEMAVTSFCKTNGLGIRFIRQMDLANGYFSIVEGGTGGNCSLCNRLRLTANGKLKPCLFDDIELDIREMGYEKALKRAVELKPECGSKNISGEFYNIGG